MEQNRVPLILTSREQELQRDLGKPMSAILAEAIDGHPSIGAAAASIGVSRMTFYSYLRKHGVPWRHIRRTERIPEAS